MAWMSRDHGGWTLYTPFELLTTKGPSPLPTLVLPAVIGVTSGASTGLRAFLSSERRTPWASPVLLTMGVGQTVLGHSQVSVGPPP